MTHPWIEAMRLRTLPVSMAGVLAGGACALQQGRFFTVPFICCMLFALLAQIASNFANEYFDYRNGLDVKGREGFRRGVTEGDISPKAMRTATFATLGAAAIPGCCLIAYGGWWMLPIGIVIFCFALAYSTGPYPLSHHGLGDIAVIIFFGLVPVCLTSWLCTANDMNVFKTAFPIGCGIGLIAADVLIVNNIRDVDTDRAVHKNTTAVIFGTKAMKAVYILFMISGITLLCIGSTSIHHYLYIPIFTAPLAILACTGLITSTGARLNNVLRLTAQTLLLASVILFILAIA